MSSSASVSVSNSHPSIAPKWADCSEYIQMLTTRRLFPVDSPDHSPLLWHFRVLSGHPSQEAGGAPALGTADADKVPRSHHITRSLCRHLMGNHCVLANLLKNLWDFYWLLIFLHFFFCQNVFKPISVLKHKTLRSYKKTPANCKSYLDLFDIWVPIPHLLHVSHKLFVQIVRMLLQHHFQLEHLPDVWQRLTQDFVSVCLRRWVKQELELLTHFLSH